VNVVLAFAAYQDALAPAGPYAQKIANIWWIYFTICTVVWVLVMIGVFVAVRRAQRRVEPDTTTEGTAHGVKFMTFAIGTTTVVLIALLVVTVATARSLSPHGQKVAREIQVTGHQWWWDIQYLDERPDRIAQTANELHLAVGERVRIILASSDVIHSFWIPNLHGKRDLIPGQKAILTIQADKPGIYRAQCAEFCGLQHAKMAFIVIVEPKGEFDAWLTTMRAPAPHPKDADQQRGQQVFLMTSCVMCHAIKGTSAGARTGPDLTHVGSRRTLGAGVIPNSRGNLAGWIADAGGVKPGVLMPPNQLDSDDLHALVAYLEALK
jgi:cytochrome c oxidase subunit 2